LLFLPDFFDAELYISTYPILPLAEISLKLQIGGDEDFYILGNLAHQMA